MKRYGYLFESICSFENLLLASKKAQKGKRFKRSTSVFNLNLENELLCLQQELQNQTYQIGSYKQFYIHDPKKRLISAAPYRDRVVQHALCNIIEPLFDRTFIYDTYACRNGKGSHKAVERFTKFSRKNDYVLKCDVKSYFASIDHETLWRFILKKIKDKQVLWLTRQILDSTVSPGIPIGNLASQIFANLYLNELDHYLKEDVECPCYLRYMDDLVVFSNDKAWLTEVKKLVRIKLVKMKLAMHEDKSQIYETKNGVPFLGYKIWPSHRLILAQNIKRFRLRMKKYFKLLEKEVINSHRIFASIQSWLGFAGHADSYNLRLKLAREFNILACLPACLPAGRG
jgi:retron-type reverse transcriptase